MRNQFSTNRNRSSRLVPAFLIVILLSVVLFGFDTLTSGLVRSYARTLGSLGWGALASATTAVNANGLLTTRSALARENIELQERVALYEEEIARYRAIQIQNDSLREMARLVETEGSAVTARVLSSFRVSPYGTFLIGAGEQDGVMSGSLVLTPGGFVLGTVSDSDTHTATVDAVFAPAHTTDVIVNEYAMAAEGRGGGNARAELPRDAVVAVGDAIIVPEFNGRIAGVIGKIESASSSATQTLFIRLPQNLDTLRFVYVIPRQ